MDRHQLERVQPDERIRGHLVNAFVWYFCVSFANIYRSSQQKIKLKLQILNITKAQLMMHLSRLQERNFNNVCFSSTKYQDLFF